MTCRDCGAEGGEPRRALVLFRVLDDGTVRFTPSPTLCGACYLERLRRFPRALGLGTPGG